MLSSTTLPRKSARLIASPWPFSNWISGNGRGLSCTAKPAGACAPAGWIDTASASSAVASAATSLDRLALSTGHRRSLSMSGRIVSSRSFALTGPMCLCTITPSLLITKVSGTP